MRRSLSLAFAAGLLLVLARCRPAVADAAPAPRDVTVGLLAGTADSLRVHVQWTASSDAAGAADHYVDSVFAGATLLRAHTSTGLADTVMVARPAAASSITLSVRVHAIRRTISSAASVQTWSYTQSDVAPPAPGGVTVDTLAIVLPAARTVAILPSGFSALPGDSVKVRAVVLTSTGDTLTPTGTIVWTVGDTARQLIHPIPGTAQAWAIRRPVT